MDAMATLESNAPLGLLIPYKPLADNVTIDKGTGDVLGLGFWD
jgi:hypothetical protein